jgi:hypothetical protein
MGTIILADVVKFAIIFAIVVVFDFVFKIKAQITFAISWKKRLPISYSLLPWIKLSLILLTASAGTWLWISGPDRYLLPSVVLAISALAQASYASFLYRKEMEEQQS